MSDPSPRIIANPYYIWKTEIIKFVLVGAYLLKGYYFILRISDMERVLSSLCLMVG